MSIFDFFNRPRREFKPDELLPFISSPQGEQAIALTSLDIQVSVSGLYSETVQTMTFYNPNHRVLEGELSFPLPDNAVVCGYALDVQGQMVDGVVVPKEEARQILETEIRKGVDPGLVEHVQGNIYRTRIYPIPARGSRTIRINYVSDLAVNDDEAAYHLPLRHAEQIGNVKLRVEVFQNKVKPELSGFGNLSLTQWEDRWVAEAELKSNKSDDLLIRLPQLPSLLTSVERNDDDYFFNISARLGEPESTAWHPKHIGIVWDASGSRQGTGTDLDFLAALADRWPDARISLMVFRNVSEEVKSFDDLKELINYLKEIPYDGGTDLAGLDFTKFPLTDLEGCLLFSDGLNNMSQGLPAGFEKPVIGINSQTHNDNAYLEYIAEQSGGIHLNLIRTPVDKAVERLINFGPKIQIESAVGCEAVHLSHSQGRVNILGRLTADEAELKLQGAGAPASIIILKKAEAAEGKIIARAWAERESRQIALIDKFSKDLVNLGRRFGLVTPGTSLLVLESLEQYLEYRIEPPRSLEMMYRQYHKKLEALDRQKKQTEQEQISRVFALWERRISWWETDYKSAYIAEEKRKKDLPPPVLNNVPTGSLNRAFDSIDSSEADFMDFIEAAPAEIFEGIATQSMPFSSAPPTATFSAAPPMMAASAAPGGAPELERAQKSEAPKSAAASISIQAWSPETPYLAKIREAGREHIYDEYLKQRKDYQKSPSFFLDCGDYLFKQGEKQLALRVLSNLLELELDDIPLLRIYGWRLQQAGELDAAIGIFERVRKIRTDEPQSHRDLALALGDRWLLTGDRQDALESIRLLYDVISKTWDRFPEIEIIALMEMNRLIYFCTQKGIETPEFVDRRLIKNLDLDVRISMSWDADLTDVDLHVFEPDEGHAYYGHNQTRIGGLVSLDFRQGYGPEEYVLRNAMPGRYLIKTHYYGSHQQTLSGPCTVTATVFTNYGRIDEKKQILTLRLEAASSQEPVGEIVIEGAPWLEPQRESAWSDELISLVKGMTIDEVKGRLGNPDDIRGNEHIILVYRRGSLLAELHFSPRLSAVKQIMPGAELDLLT